MLKNGYHNSKSQAMKGVTKEERGGVPIHFQWSILSLNSMMGKKKGRGSKEETAPTSAERYMIAGRTSSTQSGCLSSHGLPSTSGVLYWRGVGIC